MTVWRTVAEAPDYVVSDAGEVMRAVADVRGLNRGRVLKPAPNTQGYPHVSLCVGGKHITRAVHVIVCRAFHGEKPGPNFHASHADGDKTNNAASNLRWATVSENMMDKHRHGRMPTGDRNGTRTHPERRPRGERHAMAKLTDAIVAQIKRGGETQTAAARRFGVSQATISDIRIGKIWKHVQAEGAMSHG